jgi:WD40 repeat protein
MKHSSEVSQVAISPDGRLALSVCEDGTAHLWDVASCTRLVQPLRYERAIARATFNTDGSHILFQCKDGGVLLYETPRPLPNDDKLVRTWARARTGLRLDNKGMLKQLSEAEWLQAQRELAAFEKN